ncbi:hypothetical protein BRYFOR_08428 [Marvinbryantia formatexigens DSM 14469]|uniref:Uncharacterized protein n=1 Tax=Marvinbryantia formatexigens DSM 14469 TaxID=478749 RepID=C6LIJ0_9FIRM|nr:hypothetical protein BRYFOR_08428 [Marvinbryantia formatexigens DSM 14469]
MAQNVTPGDRPPSRRSAADSRWNPGVASFHSWGACSPGRLFLRFYRATALH